MGRRGFWGFFEDDVLGKVGVVFMVWGIVYFFNWWGKYCCWPVVDLDGVQGQKRFLETEDLGLGLVFDKAHGGLVAYFRASFLPLIVSFICYSLFNQAISSPYRKGELDTIFGLFKSTKYGGYAYGLTTLLVFLLPSLVGVFKANGPWRPR